MGEGEGGESKNVLWDEWGLNLRNCYRLKESTVREETA